MNRLRPHFPFLTVLLLPVLLYHWRILFGEIICGGDMISQFVPWREFALQEIAQGRFPLWNPFVFCGTPFAANIQTSLFYPLNLFNLIFSVERTFSLSLAFHHAMAAVAMYAFLYRLWGDRGGAVIGAIAYSWSGFFITHGYDGHLIHIRAYAWLPLSFYLQTRWRDGVELRHVALFAASLAMLFYSGHIQLPLYVFYLLVFRGLWWGIQDFRRSRTIRSFLHYPFWTLAGQTLAIGMAALILIPLAELSRETAGRAGGADYQFATSDSMPPSHILTLVAPFLYGNPSAEIREEQFWETRTGYHEISGYIGILPLLLAGFAFLPRSKDEKQSNFSHNECLFFALLAGCGIAFALGSYTPLYKILYYGLPGWSYFRVPGRLLLFFIIGLSVLAARGFHQLQQMKFNQAFSSRACLMAAIFTFLAGIGIVILLSSREAVLFWLREFEIDRTITEYGLWTAQRSAISQRLPEILFETRYALMVKSCLLAGGLFVTGWMSLIFVAKTQFQFRWLLPAVLLIGDIMLFAGHFTKTLPAGRWRETYFPNSELIQIMQKNVKDGRVLCLDDAIGYPILNFHPELRPNRLMHYGIRDARGYDPIILRSYARYVNRIFNKPLDASQGGLLFFPALPAEDELDRMNVRLILTSQPISEAYPKIWQSKESGLAVYENTDCKPMVFAETSPENAELTIHTMDPARIELDAKLNEGNRIYIAQNDYPGWNLVSSNSCVSISQANAPFQAIEAPAGDHTISLQMNGLAFDPLSSFTLGGAITILTLGLGGYLLVQKRG